ncbi:YopX family protein [Anaerosinus massiliensis]|uniref:YopX family protein n=1 Tax=Massilibacillus massiliensis TaxID=1806837 RepID=UPI000A5AC279|nr:YopX family protein [Massilibacillus massiliensis]
MREIKFRGKRLDNGEWVYGYLVKMFGQICIMDLNDENAVYPVNPKTVGQHTGLKDKHGKDIYEGDIVAFTEYPGDNYYAEICKSEQAPLNWLYGYIKKPNSKVMGISNGIYYSLRDIGELGEVEIIGNIYENPELVEGQA